MEQKVILLLIMAGIPVLTAVIGLKKGFFKQLFGMCALLVALAAAFFLSPMVTGLLNEHTSLHDRAEAFAAERIDGFLEQYDAESGAQVEEALSKSYLPKAFVRGLIEKVDAGVSATREEYVSRLSKSAADYTVKVCGVAVTFIAAWLLLGIIMAVLGILDKLPVIREANHGLGMAVGLIKGVLIVWLLCNVIAAMGHTEFGQSLTQTITEDPVLSTVYDYALAFTGLLMGGGNL